MKTLILAFFLLTASAVYADVTITEESSGATLTSYYSKNIMAHYIDGQLTNITDVGKETVYVINPMNKTYFAATFAKMREFAKEIRKAADSDLAKQFNGDTPKIDVKVTRKGVKKIAGYSCDEYLLTVEALFTEANVCFSKELYSLVENELDRTKAERLMNEMDMDEQRDPIGARIAELERTNGYVLEQVSTGGVPGFDTLVTSVSRKNIDKSVFRVPAGYRLIPMDQALGTY